jgi:hypothetical protein
MNDTLRPLCVCIYHPVFAYARNAPVIHSTDLHRYTTINHDALLRIQHFVTVTLHCLSHTIMPIRS